MEKKFTTTQAKSIGDSLGINWTAFYVEEFRTGLDIEMEHGLINPQTNITNDDPLLTGKIALAHLNEIPDYYTRLNILEEEGKKYWEKKIAN